MTPRGGYVGILSGVLVAAAVSFLIASLFLKRSSGGEAGNLEKATKSMEAIKGKKSTAASMLSSQNPVRKIVFACDAGMGSSAGCGTTVLKNKVNKAGLEVEVTHTSISQLPEDAVLVITHKNLTDRAKEKLPHARHISVDNFLNSPEYDALISG